MGMSDIINLCPYLPFCGKATIIVWNVMILPPKFAHHFLPGIQFNTIKFVNHMKSSCTF